MKKASTKAQGATEYLVLLAAVLIIALTSADGARWGHHHEKAGRRNTACRQVFGFGI